MPLPSTSAPARRAAVLGPQGRHHGVPRPDGKTRSPSSTRATRPCGSNRRLSTQHAADIDLDALLCLDVRKTAAAARLLEATTSTPPTTAAGQTQPAVRDRRPDGDAGLTGRPSSTRTRMARHGGRAFSGKDPSKVATVPPHTRSGWAAERGRRRSRPPIVRSRWRRHPEGRTRRRLLRQRDLRYGDRADPADPGRSGPAVVGEPLSSTTVTPAISGAGP